MDEEKRGPFRRQAIEAHALAPNGPGAPLRVSPGWTRWTYRGLLLLLATSLVASTIIVVRDNAEGLGVVWVARVAATCPASGIVVSVSGRAEESVERGAVLAQLDDEAERAELERVTRELEHHLASYLSNPNDRQAAGVLRSLRAQADLAEGRVEARRVHAPVAGVVRDVLVRPGQRVEPGQTVLTIAEARDTPGCQVMAFLPADSRPFLRAGMPAEVGPTGFRAVHLRGIVESIDDQALGPRACARLLGDEVGDAFNLPGPRIRVAIRLPSDRFQAGGAEQMLHHGMTGVVTVPVRSRSVLATLLLGESRR